MLGTWVGGSSPPLKHRHWFHHPPDPWGQPFLLTPLLGPTISSYITVAAPMERAALGPRRGSTQAQQPANQSFLEGSKKWVSGVVTGQWLLLGGRTPSSSSEPESAASNMNPQHGEILGKASDDPGSSWTSQAGGCCVSVLWNNAGVSGPLRLFPRAGAMTVSRINIRLCHLTQGFSDIGCTLPILLPRALRINKQLRISRMF